MIEPEDCGFDVAWARNTGMTVDTISGRMSDMCGIETSLDGKDATGKGAAGKERVGADVQLMTENKPTQYKSSRMSRRQKLSNGVQL